MTYPLGHYGILRFVSESNSTDKVHESKSDVFKSFFMDGNAAC